jgi:glycosyltransferase involved in cell wall biosynthesis
VSVVVTTYNRAAKLPATLDTILAQDFADFELVVSDDCSSDGTEAVARSYERRDPRVRYRRNPQNLRMPGNLNAAIAAARGELVANLHDDDFYRPDLLSRWMAALDRYPTAAFVFNAYEVIDARGRKRLARVPMPPCMPGRDFLRRFFVTQWGSPIFGTVMARKACYDAVGPFDPRYSMNSDVEMWARLAQCFDVAYVDEPLITITPREPDHVLARHYLWELSVDVRVKRDALRAIAPKDRLSHLAFELRARTHYACAALAPIRRGRLGEARAALRMALTGRDTLAPPKLEASPGGAVESATC